MPRFTAPTRAARQERILQATVVCVARRGDYATPMEEIAAEVRIAKGAA